MGDSNTSVSKEEQTTYILTMIIYITFCLYDELICDISHISTKSYFFSLNHHIQVLGDINNY